MRDRIEGLLTRLRRGIRRADQAFEKVEGESWELVVYPRPYPWTVRDLLAHLASAEESLLWVAQDVVSGGVGAPEGFDFEGYNASEQERLAKVLPAQLLRELREHRAETISWVEGLDESLLTVVGRHPALGEISVETFIRAIYGHQLMHVRDLMRILAQEDMAEDQRGGFPRQVGRT
ncbi:MAG: DinB family protein [Anaerolineae bacterium]|jgi:hypothetical protein